MLLRTHHLGPNSRMLKDCFQREKCTGTTTSSNPLQYRRFHWNCFKNVSFWRKEKQNKANWIKWTFAAAKTQKIERFDNFFIFTNLSLETSEITLEVSELSIYYLFIYGHTPGGDTNKFIKQFLECEIYSRNCPKFQTLLSTTMPRNFCDGFIRLDCFPVVRSSLLTTSQPLWRQCGLAPPLPKTPLCTTLSRLWTHFSTASSNRKHRRAICWTMTICCSGKKRWPSRMWRRIEIGTANRCGIEHYETLGPIKLVGLINNGFANQI